ncbi:hypothetical protein KGM_206112 [Danaus plexippus plexippus]|uniref:Uncharacterized protein n=1 Tax=Danaus plexippus plexippus TaxID=278856 RepID=A0A212EIH8_DANPL|nr:hypothetical protein KGM_206112 [Danaus plexippus plexippus]
MDPQRKVTAGPMAPSSLKTARKSFAVTKTYVKDMSPQKEIITVHTSTPNIEHRSFHSEQNQIYQGEVNVLSIIDTNKEIMCCKYTEDVKDIAAGFIDGTIRLFDCNNGDCKHILVDDECRAYPGPVTSIKHRPVSKAHPITNMLLSSYVNGCIKCWKYKYEQCLYTIREKRQTLGLCYHPRYSKFVTYGDDAKLNMYDEEAQTQERAFYSSQRKNIRDGHTSRIFSCVFNPKSHHELISGGWDDTIMCWDDRQPYSTRYFSGVHMCGEGLDFDKPGKQTECSIRNNPGAIYAFDFGTIRRKQTKIPDTYKKISEIQNCPRVAFVTGKRLQTVDFG